MPIMQRKGWSKILYIKVTTKTALDHLKHIHGISGKSTNIYTQSSIEYIHDYKVEILLKLLDIIVQRLARIFVWILE